MMIALKSEEHLNKAWSFVGVFIFEARYSDSRQRKYWQKPNREDFVFDKHRITHVKFKQSAEKPVKGKTFSCVFHSQMKNCDP